MSCISHINLCPSSGDTENVLLQKILQSLNNGGGGSGGGVTGLSVNGGAFQTGQVSIVTGGGGGVSSVNGDAGPAVLLVSSEIPESGSLYFTEVRVRAALLTGLVVAAGAITAADSVLSAFGKTQFRLNALETGASGPFVLRAGDTMTGPLTITPSATDVTLLDLNSFSLTGATAIPAQRITGEWNTTGAPTILDVDVLNSASGSASLLFNFKLSTVSILNLRKDGRLQLAGRISATDSSGVGQSFVVSNASTGAATTVVGLFHTLTAGIPVIGFGNSVDWSFDSTTTVNTLAARLITQWTDPTHATRSSQFLFQTMNSGALVTGFQIFNGQGLFTPGSAAIPSISFSNDINTGLYNPGVDQIGLTTGGVVRVTISTTGVTFTLPILMPDGTAALPAYSFASDPNTGIFQTGVADTIGISTGGVVRWTLNTTALTTTLQFLAAAGSAALPTYSFSADPNTGIFQTGVADTLGLSTGGVVRVTLNTVNLTSTLAIVAPVGTVSLPGYTFAGDTDTGIYSAGAESLSITTQGVARVLVATTIIVTTLPIQGQAGSAATPAFSFSGDPDTGIYDVSADVLGFSVGGVLRKSISTTQVISTLVNVGPAGTAALPTFSFSGDPNTGIYNVGADQLGISTGGTLRITYSTTDTIHAAGYRLAVSSGANQRAGNAVLVAGTVTVANTSVTANTLILLTRKTSGGTIGVALTYTVIAATSFTITSDSAIDTSTISYFLIEVP